jgi:hypothetical protein
MKACAFVRDGNISPFKPSTPTGKEPIVRIHPQPQIVIVGPRSLAVEDIAALEAAFRSLNASVHSFRMDESFRLGQLQPHLARSSHLLVILDREDEGQTTEVLLAADASSNASVCLLCLHTCESLRRYHKRLDNGSVRLIIVRSHQEHARVRTDWNKAKTLVADQCSLATSAKEIARTFVGKPKQEQLRTFAKG